MAFTNEYTLNVDIKKRMANVVPIFRQGDTAKLNFRVYDNGVLYDLTGYTRSEITFRLPSGETLINNCILNQGIISYTFIGAEMAEVGDLSVILSIYSGNTVVSIQPFTIHIYDNMRHDTLSYISILQDLIQQVQYLELETRPLIEEVAEIKDELEQLELEISNAEAIRVANEITRVGNEDTRISNEQTRVSSEQERLQAEGTRLINESNRVNSENLRVIAEQARVNAENLRISGSQERFEHFDTIIDNFDFVGDYNANTQYYRFNNVYYQGSTWTALKSVIGIPPTDDNINWKLSARKGVDGQGAVASVNGFLPDLDGNVVVPVAEVVNNFDSYDTTKAISANKGRELKVLVDNKIIASEVQPTTQVSNDMWFDISDTAIDSIDIENAVLSNIPPINQNLLWFDESEQGNITIKKFINGQWLPLNPHTTISQVDELLPILMSKANVSDVETLASIISNLNIQLNNLSNTVEVNTTKINDVELNLNQLISKKGQPNGYASLNANGKVPSSQLDITINDASTTQKGIVQLINRTDSDSVELAPTAQAVKHVQIRANDAYDLAEQAFQFANDGKTRIGNVIGIPANETFAQMEYHIQWRKDELATNLNNKGVTANGNEDLLDLINKVPQIQSIRESSGTVTSTTTQESYYRLGAVQPSPMYSITVSNLGYIPKQIRVVYHHSGALYETVDYKVNTMSNGVISTNINGTYGIYSSNAGVAYINSTGFKLPVVSAGVQFTWYVTG